MEAISVKLVVAHTHMTVAELMGSLMCLTKENYVAMGELHNNERHVHQLFKCALWRW